MDRTRRHHAHEPDMQAVYTRRRFLVGGAAAALPLGAWWTLGRRSADDVGTGSTSASPPTQNPPSSAASTFDPPPATATEPTGPTTTSTIPPLDHELVEGMVDPKVGRMQQRLADLAFDPGPVDDYYGAATIRAVWAFKKLVMGIERERADGTVTGEVWETMFGPVDIAPRRQPGGRHLEVYLPEQVAVLYFEGAPRVVSHVSSGEGVEWCDEVTVDLDDGTTETRGICGLSVTPGGVYRFERKVEGWRNAKLGRLYKPVYFNYGIAIHGATNVPNYPASRGCVRYPMHIAEYIQDLVEIGDRVYVFDGVEEPQHYGAQPMIFDWPDPDYTTTTTTSTTTTMPEPVATTTTAPAPPTTSSTSTTTPAPTSTTTTTTAPLD